MHINSNEEKPSLKKEGEPRNTAMHYAIEGKQPTYRQLIRGVLLDPELLGGFVSTVFRGSPSFFRASKSVFRILIHINAYLHCKMHLRIIPYLIFAPVSAYSRWGEKMPFTRCLLPALRCDSRVAAREGPPMPAFGPYKLAQERFLKPRPCQNGSAAGFQPGLLPHPGSVGPLPIIR